MDKFDRHRGGDRFNDTSEEAHHHTSSSRRGFPSSRFPEGGGGAGGGGNSFHQPRQENYRSGDGSEHHRPFNSPSRYPPPFGGGEGGGLRPIGDGNGGFRPVAGGRGSGGGFGPMGGPGGGGFRPMGADARGFRPMGGDGGDDGRFQPMGGEVGDGGGFRVVGSGRGDGRGFRPMGGDGGGFRPMGSGRGNGRGFGRIGGDGGDGGGFQPMGGGSGGDDVGFAAENYHMPHPPPLTGHKRGYPFAGGERSPDKFNGASFAKLFVGSVPRTATEEDVRPLFDKHGRVMEVALIKDKRTGQQQGCCFIKYASSEEADRAIKALHNQCILPGGTGPIQVRYADGERERLGATEYKLFVGSLNKQATEREVEEIFVPYGRVEDVYLMRDEMKQSRGCGFVKYSQREMAQAAINALNGTYIMRGCDQPLTVRFADPKRPRPGESRGSPALGGPGIGSHFSAPEIRPLTDFGQPPRGPIPPNSWPPVSPQNVGLPSNVGIQGFSNQLPSRSGDIISSSTPGPVGGLPANADSSRPSVPVSQMPLQSPQQFPSASQLQPPNSTSFSSMQMRGPHMQAGQMQMPNAVGQNPYGQAPPSQQLPGLNGQLPVPQPQMQHNATGTPGQARGRANQQQLPVQQLQPLDQSPSQLAQMLSQQKQTLQATFQSSQQAFNQLQQQLHQLQPSNQNLTAHQGPQIAKQQSPWAGITSHPVGNASAGQSAGDLTPTTASSTVSAVTLGTATVKCNWTEHTAPDGYKYYYNSSTGESKWEKPEELTLHDQQQQQQQKPSNEHPQVQRHPQGPSAQHAHHMQVHLLGQNQVQLQNQIRPLQQASQSSAYHDSAHSAKQGTQEHSYAQTSAGSTSVNDPARYQQGLTASQGWMWRNKPSGGSAAQKTYHAYQMKNKEPDPGLHSASACCIQLEASQTTFG